MKKGCLSGNPLGFGTEKNEQIHQLLNCSLLTRATRILKALAVALLTVLFYRISCKAPSNMNHKCNTRVQCIQPPWRNVASTGETMWSPFMTESTPLTVDAACQSGNETTRNLRKGIESSSPELLIVEDINDVCAETVEQCIMFQFPPRISSTAYIPITAINLTIRKICYSLQTTQMVCADNSDFSSLADTTITEHQVRLHSSWQPLIALSTPRLKMVIAHFAVLSY